ncbi:MAG: hypothetical protein P8M63_07480 [Paracoccaceae bacterium]|nr:hypothetical protein [Paracoccaceae bacterium]
MSASLDELMSILPEDVDATNDKDAMNAQTWLEQAKPLMFAKFRDYVSPENVIEAAIPTSIVLGSTVIGTMLGMPVLSALVGGLLTRTTKPSKAVDDILNPSN